MKSVKKTFCRVADPNQNAELNTSVHHSSRGRQDLGLDYFRLVPSWGRIYLLNTVLAKLSSLWLLHQHGHRSRNSVWYWIPLQGQHDTFLGHVRQLKQKKVWNLLILFLICTVQVHPLPPDRDGFQEKIHQACGVPALQWEMAHVWSTRSCCSWRMGSIPWKFCISFRGEPTVQCWNLSSPNQATWPQPSSVFDNGANTSQILS